MVVNFGAVDIRDHPTLILRNLDGTAIQTLGYAFNLSAELYYNETSSISFDLPAYVDGVKTPHYDDVVGMRIVDVKDWGQFILVNPQTENDGIREVKKCKAYSLEYELTFKKIFIEDGTYNFWNPVAQSETVLGIILGLLPSWSAGEVDERLVGKYRTFSVDDDNIYNFIKSTVQESYGCIFDFDTYSRKINVVSTESIVATKPVSVSLDNLAKQISVEEDTENIFTCLDVNGADGVDIRSVNPTGTNKIYNLEYYMTPTNFSQNLIDRYHQWVSYCEEQRLPYNNLTVELSLLGMAIATEEYFIAEANGNTIVALEAQRTAAIEYLGTNGYDAPSSAQMAAMMQQLTGQIDNVKTDIIARKNRLASLQEEKANVLQQMIAINHSTSWEAFFSLEERVVLDRYIKEDAIQDSTFVAEDVRDYTNTDTGKGVASDNFTFSGGIVTKTEVGGRTIYNIRGGYLASSNSASNVSGAVISGAAENIGGRIIVTAYMSQSVVFDISTPKSCVTVWGTPGAVTDDCGGDGVGTTLSVPVSAADIYYTQETTEFSRFTVEMELLRYGEDCLNKLAYPSYTFRVSSANFLALEDFAQFRSNLSLGKKIYLSLAHQNAADNLVLQPILVGVLCNFEDPTSFDMRFGDTYSLNDASFNLVDLIEQSVSMGKTLDTKRFNYDSFVSSGASTEVRDFIDSALDVSHNQILSSGDMAISWNEAGLYLRKWAQNHVDYQPEQIAMINNMIAFTPDGWETVKMAIGHFIDSNAGDVWGVVAPNIVGTLLAGENLVIESQKQDGGVSVFKVDSNGAVLHNAKFELVDENGYGHILLDPDIGFGIGDFPVVNPQTGQFDYDPQTDTGKAKFWVDMSGNIHFRGTLEGANGKFSGALEAATGTFSGELQAASGTFSGNLQAAGGSFSGDITGSTGTFTGVVKASDFLDANGNSMMDNGKFDSQYLDLGNITLNGTTGDITLGGNIYISGNIQWNSSNSPVSVQYSANGTSNWHTTYASTDYFARYSYDGGTTWTSAVRIQGTNGSDANVNYTNVFNALTNNGTQRGVFYGYNPSTGYDQGALYINADYIRAGHISADYIGAGTIDANVVKLSMNYNSTDLLSLQVGVGQDDYGITYGPMLLYEESNGFQVLRRSYCFASASGARLTHENLAFSTSHWIGVTDNGCYADGMIISSSDRRIKSDINYNVDKYDDFYMSLKPCSFIMNNQNGLNTGFIAQDVVEALTDNKLTMDDFAGVQINAMNGYKDFHSLSYASFVSLNTHMIQKLYKRIDALEEELRNIKEKT